MPVAAVQPGLGRARFCSRYPWGEYALKSPTGKFVSPLSGEDEYALAATHLRLLLGAHHDKIVLGSDRSDHPVVGPERRPDGDPNRSAQPSR